MKPKFFRWKRVGEVVKIFEGTIFMFGVLVGTILGAVLFPTQGKLHSLFWGAVSTLLIAIPIIFVAQYTTYYAVEWRVYRRQKGDE